MIELTDFFADNTRVQVYRPGPCAESARCVLYWMQRSQRAQENHALNAAIALANALSLPVLVLFVITDYPSANLRHYHFMLEGMDETARTLAGRGIPLLLRQGSPVDVVPALAHELSAAAVISDFSELRLPRLWRQKVSERLSVPFVCVDADTVVPMHLFPKEEWAARTLRPKVALLLPEYLQPVVDLEPDQRLEHPPCDPGNVTEPLSYLHTLSLDRSVPPSAQFHGGQSRGKQAIQRFLSERLRSYAEQRNHPEVAGTSELSAYLHFGQISVQQLAWDIEHADSSDAQSPPLDQSGGPAAYLEEVIVRRELAVNFAFHNPHYDALVGCPDWAQATLQKHASDPRDRLYTLDELEHARTHDELWNACQREMLLTGRMHGYMRMYWAKKILEWTATPEEAFAFTLTLNDKYELDGRDANGYTGIAWAIGGKHDRPWGPERPIFGLVRYMSLYGMQRKMDTRRYIAQWSPSSPLTMHTSTL